VPGSPAAKKGAQKKSNKKIRSEEDSLQIRGSRETKEKASGQENWYHPIPLPKKLPDIAAQPPTTETAAP
jgi:hypothetical protein